MRVVTTYYYINTLLSLIHFYSLGHRCFLFCLFLLWLRAPKNVVYCCLTSRPKFATTGIHHPINDFVLVDYLLLNSKRASLVLSCFFPDSLVVVSQNVWSRARGEMLFTFVSSWIIVVFVFCFLCHTHTHTQYIPERATVDHPSILEFSPRAHMLLCRCIRNKINQSTN